jgi:GNAT superfamily N-acetyltransferase
MADVELRRFVAADLPALRELWNAVHPDRPRSEAYDCWRFLTTPMWGSVAMAGGRCAGSYSLAPTEMNIGGQVVAGAQSLDTMTHPEFRGQGLFVKLADHCYQQAVAEGCTMVYGFPNEFSYPGMVRRLNFQHVGEAESWMRPLGRAKDARLGAVAGVIAPLLPLGPAAPELVIEPGRPPGGELAELVAETVPTRDVCRIHRGPAWFDYRYAPESGWTYEWLSARDPGGALAGTAVWRSNPRDGRSFLLELIGTAKAKSHLLRTILLAARDRGASRMGALGNDPDLVAALKAAGFMKRSPLHFMVRTFSSATLPANPRWPPAWRLVTGDFDTV